VLTEVARRLSRAVAAPNSVYRLGGDEFIVLVPEAAAVAELAGKF
jgi:GGDEF domain-containing protein